MVDYVARLADGSSFPVMLGDKPLGRGGEGAVFPVESVGSPVLGAADGLVGKVYHPDKEKQAEREAKCAAMLASVPKTDSIVWNLGNLYTPSGDFVGFLMKRLQMDVYREFMKVAHTTHRRMQFPDWSVRHSLLMARNLAVAIDAVHEAGHRVGDINESNVFVAPDATVRIVDADSVQISTGSTVYPCIVGKPEFTAPEISVGSYKEERNRRTVATDTFAFTVMLFNALMGRAHPTVCNYKGEHKDIPELIRLGVYPTFVKKLPRGFSKVPDIEYEAIPKRVHDMIGRGLSSDPDLRPSFDEIIAVFDDLFEREDGAYKNLKQCNVSPLHWWDVRDSSMCPMCRFATKYKNADIWSSKQDNTLGSIVTEGQKKQAKQQKKKKTPPASASISPYAYAPTQAPPVSQSTPAAPPVPVQLSGTQAPPYTGATPQQPQTQSNQQTQGRTPGAPEEPTMVKKYLGVLDGSGDIVRRPPLGDLVKSGSYGILIDALGAEYKRSIPWVSKYNPVPVWWVSFIASALTALVWWLGAPEIMRWLIPTIFPHSIPTQIIPLIHTVGILLWAIPAGSVGLRFLSGLFQMWRRSREVKQYGYGAVVYEKWWGTVLNTVLASVVTGLLVPLFAVLSVLFWLIYEIIVSVISSWNNDSSQT